MSPSFRERDISPKLPLTTALGASPNDPAPADLEAIVARVVASLHGGHTDPLSAIGDWLVTPPIWSEEYNVTNASGGLTLGANAVRTEVCAYQLPAGTLGVLRFLTVAVGNASDAPNVTFAVLIDGAPLHGYASIVGSMSPSIALPKPLIKFVRGNQRLSIVASNASAGAIQNVNALLSGWHWQAAAVPRGASARPT